MRVFNGAGRRKCEEGEEEKEKEKERCGNEWLYWNGMSNSLEREVRFFK